VAEAAPRGLEVRLRDALTIPLDVQISCQPGELLALVGPSGSGKTTVLRAIAGLRRVAEGRISCADATWFDAAAGVHLSPQQRRVGFVFQDFALFPHMTALGNVACALGHLPERDRPGKAGALLDLVKLGGLGPRRPAELSGGQRQRVALARALAREPAVLLMDEPFSAVDKVTRRRLHRELAELRKRVDIPIVMVTHDLDDAQVLADTMCVLHHGRTLQSGAPAELMRRPAGAEIARVLDMRNIFAGRIASSRADSGAPELLWGANRLQVGKIAAGVSGPEVSWVIPADAVVLHRRDRPSRGERENPVDGRVVECVSLGETTEIAVRVAGAGDDLLHLSLPTHVARRNGVAVNADVRCSLLADAIHLMPPR
jgi:molybdate transport system ATP-binding protein